VPYEIAMERTRDRADDIAAPMVPDDMAKAAAWRDQLVLTYWRRSTNQKNFCQGWVPKSYMPVWISHPALSQEALLTDHQVNCSRIKIVERDVGASCRGLWDM
jgi:hypothetical protein